MASWMCSVCGYTHEGDTAPEECMGCQQTPEKFVLVQREELDKPVYLDYSNFTEQNNSEDTGIVLEVPVYICAMPDDSIVVYEPKIVSVPDEESQEEKEIQLKLGIGDLDLKDLVADLKKRSEARPVEIKLVARKIETEE